MLKKDPVPVEGVDVFTFSVLLSMIGASILQNNKLCMVMDARLVLISANNNPLSIHHL